MRSHRRNLCPPWSRIPMFFLADRDPARPTVLRFATDAREPIPFILSRCALRSPPGPAFLSFSDSIRSAPHVEETCIDRPSCCLLPADALSRGDCRRPCCVAHPEPDLPLQNPSSLIASAAVARRATELFAPRTRLCGCYGYRAGLYTLSRAGVRVSRDSHDCGHVPGNSFCAFLYPVAPTVRLPYRDMLATMACTYPHPQVRSIRRSVSGLMQRTQLRVLKGCVHAHRVVVIRGVETVRLSAATSSQVANSGKTAR
jgi:hypothetical protein